MNAFKSLSPFQIALVGVFTFFAFFAMMAFSLGWFAGDNNKDQGLVGGVTVWGTLSADNFSDLVKAAFPNDTKLTVNYVEKTADTIDRQLAEAIAVGTGPDIILIPQDRFLRHQLKIQPLLLSVRDFQDTFIPQSEMYLASNQMYGLPLVVDPLVMYWNRSIFSSAGLVRPPEKWEEFFSLVPQLTIFSDPITKSIAQSTVSLGEYVNIPDAKEILSAFLLQAGDRIIARDPATGKITLYFGQDATARASESPLASVLRFYLQFSKESSPAYTWNRSLADAQEMFASGKLAIYFGLASEAPEIARRNPHLDFDVAMLPQLEASTISTTFGRMYGLSILKGKGTPLTLAVATGLAYSPAVKDFAQTESMAPAQRVLIAAPPSTDARASIFYKSALISKSWFDPDPIQTNNIFAQLINDVGSDEKRVLNAISSARQKFDQLFRSLQIE